MGSVYCYQNMWPKSDAINGFEKNLKTILSKWFSNWNIWNEKEDKIKGGQIFDTNFITKNSLKYIIVELILHW